MLWLLPILKDRAICCLRVVNNMNKKKHPFIFTFNVLIFFILILLHYTDKIGININGVSPILVLPLLTAFSIFHSPLTSAITGMLAGVVMDTCAIGSQCFNAIILLCLGAGISVTSNILFNKNVLSATVLSLITAFIYHISQWLVFQSFGKSVANSITYLLKYAMPSALIAAAFIFPFYYLYKYFNKISSN